MSPRKLFPAQAEVFPMVSLIFGNFDHIFSLVFSMVGNCIILPRNLSTLKCVGQKKKR